MADPTKLVRRVEYQADTSGLDKVAASADKAAASVKKVVDASGSMAASSEKADKSALGVAAQLDRLSKAADPVQKSLAAVERQQRLIDAATKQGQPIRQEWTNALALLKARHEEAAKAVAGHTAAVGLNRVQLMEASHVAKSFADSVIAGASPLRALSLEGGRIAQIFAEGQGGVGGTLKAMGGTVARLATGWLGLGAAVAAGAGLAAMAIYRFQSQQDRLALSLNGAGRYAGVTVAGLTGIANAAGARNPALGQGGATDLAATLASTGRISAGIMPGIMDLAAPLARGTGQDLAKVGEELAKAFADPTKGADQLNEKLGFLDDSTKQLIASLERQGDLLGAQQTLLSKAADAAARMADPTWTIARAWQSISNSIGSAFSRAGGYIESAVNGPTMQERLDMALNPRSMRGPRGGIVRSQADAGYVESLRLGVAYQQYGESRLAGAAASDKATNDLSMAIGAAVRKALPEIDKTQELTDTLKLLDDAIRNPEASAKVEGGTGAIRSAIDRYQGARAYASPLYRTQIEGSLSAQSAQAENARERTAIEARRAEIEALASLEGHTMAAAKALNVWNDAIARSNKEADDAERIAGRNLNTSLMRPFERGEAEIRYRYEDMRNNAVTGMGALPPGAGNFTALDPATAKLAKAMNGMSAPSSDLLDAAAAMPSLAFGGGAARAGAPRLASYAPAAGTFATGNIVVHGGAGAIESTSAATRAQAESEDIGAYYNSQTLAKLQAAGDELDRQQKLLAARTLALGKDNAAMEKAVATQELWNSLQLDDEAIKRLGPSRMAALTSAIDTQSTAQVALNAQQQQYNQLVSASSWFQQTGNSVVSDLGQSFGDLFNANPRNLVSQLKTGDQAKYYAGQLSGSDVKQKIFMVQAGNFLRNLMFQQGIGLIQKGLFGQGQVGQPGYQSGIFGGIFNSLLGGLGFGGGGIDATTGAAFSNSASGLSSLFSSGWSFAGGGVMTPRGPAPLRRYAGGGVADSPQLAMFGEGSTPEAYVPLPDGRRIPVAMSGGGHSINIGGHTIVVQGSADEKTLNQMRAELAAANRQMVSDLQRNFGQMSAKWQQRNGG